MEPSGLAGTIKEIAPDFFFIQRGWLNGNHFLIRSPEVVLIDTGYSRGLNQTIDLIGKLGIVPEKVQKIVLTHTHSDHVGAVPAVQKASGCPVLLHPISRHYITHKNAWATWWRYYDQEAAFFETHQDLRDGETISLGGLAWQIHHVPGHASGQIALFEPTGRILISSDAWWANDIGVLTPRIEGLDCAFRALKSLKRLKDLEPAVVYPGHGSAFKNPAESFENITARIQQYLLEPRTQGLDQIKKILVFTLLMKNGLPASSLFDNFLETPWFGETVELFFPKERPRPIFDQIIDELMGKGVIKAEGSFLTAQVDA